MSFRLPLLPFLSVLLTLVGPVIAEEKPPRPNIIVILCDDLGWGDLQNYGHPTIKTPHLMRMAEEGIRFTSFYSAAPVCSPARAGLLTGRIPNRTGVYDWIPSADPGTPPKRSRAFVHLRDEEFTVADMLKAAGYATCVSGKWHCNAMFNSDEQPQPDDHGFDHWFATQNNAAPSHENPVNFVRNGEPVGPIQGYSCRIVADEAVSWMERHHAENPDQPFFLYVAYHEPHEPVASPPAMVRNYERGRARNHDEAQYFANVENLDAATGDILTALEELDIDENTLVIFTSDNGPETLNRYRSAHRSYGRPGPLRGMKLWTTEAGFRVAGIMRWPAGIEPGQISDVPVSSLDFLPTFAALSGAELPGALHLDGTNFLPVLSGGTPERTQPLFWIYYNAINERRVAMRQGDGKVLASLGPDFPKLQQVDEDNIEQVRSSELTDFQFFDLSGDVTEAEPGDPDPALIETMRALYRDVVDDSPAWPAVGGGGR